MTDPYKVLNIPSTATDEEVKKAYRELARKYHPDNYHDNPLADLAQEKMKEINEAYDTIQRQRQGRGSGGGGYAQQKSGYGYQQRQQSYSGSGVFQRVRMTGSGTTSRAPSATGGAGWTRPGATIRTPARWTPATRSTARPSTTWKTAGRPTARRATMCTPPAAAAATCAESWPAPTSCATSAALAACAFSTAADPLPGRYRQRRKICV